MCGHSTLPPELLLAPGKKTLKSHIATVMLGDIPSVKIVNSCGTGQDLTVDEGPTQSVAAVLAYSSRMTEMLKGEPPPPTPHDGIFCYSQNTTTEGTLA